MLVYSLFDRKMKEYGQLTLAKNDEAVERALLDALTSGGRGPVVTHPEDYDLMCVGRFDEERGVLEGSPARFVLNARTSLDAASVESSSPAPVLRVERAVGDDA